MLFAGEEVEEGLRRLVASWSPRLRRCRRACPSGASPAGAPGTTSTPRSTKHAILEHLAAAARFRDRAPGAARHLPDRRRLHAGDGRLAGRQAAVPARHGSRCGRHRAPPASRRACGSRRSWSATAAASSPSIPTGWCASARRASRWRQMTFYGEFRWHKRSEEYYILDITHPDAEAYIRSVFRTWRATGAAATSRPTSCCSAREYGPDRARWHRARACRASPSGGGWRALIREEIGDALWLGCGCPLWASVGLVDAMRIGRDIGVSWQGDYSAEKPAARPDHPQPRLRHPVAGRPRLHPAARPLP